MSFFDSRDADAGSGAEHAPRGEVDGAVDRFGRLRDSRALGGERFDFWRCACIGIIGLGILGSHLAPEIVRSGARVWICDFDLAKLINLATQNLRAGLSKVASVIDICNAIEPGRASGTVADVRDIGIGVFVGLDLIIDCTDDPNLALFLTRISNGLGIPLLRLAVDGSGRAELGRVLTSHGGEGHSCQCCSMTLEDASRMRPRTPCPGGDSGGMTRQQRPTLATTGLALTVVGIGLLQAQRLICAQEGTEESDAVLDRQVVVDLDHYMTQPLELPRSSECVTGHERWQLVRLQRPAESIAFDDLGQRARQLRPEMAAANVTFEVLGHPLQLAATCECGEQFVAVGFAGQEPPTCTRGHATTWLSEVSMQRFTWSQARALGIATTTLAGLGSPRDGALVVVTGDHQPPVHFLLESSLASNGTTWPQPGEETNG